MGFINTGNILSTALYNVVYLLSCGFLCLFTMREGLKRSLFLTMLPVLAVGFAIMVVGYWFPPVIYAAIILGVPYIWRVTRVDIVKVLYFVILAGNYTWLISTIIQTIGIDHLFFLLTVPLMALVMSKVIWPPLREMRRSEMQALIPVTVFLALLSMFFCSDYFIVSTDNDWPYVLIIFMLTIMTFAVYYLMLVMIKKVAENARLEADRQKSRMEADTLRRSNEMRQEFVNNLSHELQAPLTVLTGFAQYTSDIADTEGTDPSQIKENMRQILFETGRTERMVLQLLDAAAVENGQFIMHFTPVDMTDLIEKVAYRYFGALDMNENRLSLSIGAGLPLVYADEERILQVLVNLVSNAVKHTKGGEISIGASVDGASADGVLAGSASVGDMVIVSVRDDGEGVRPDILPQLFKRYPGKRAGRAGTGLGLYICKQIVDAHGGQISVESKPGEGAVFRFTLPAIKEKEERDQTQP